MKIRKIIAGVLCAALGISLCGCGEAKVPELSEDSSAPAAAAYKTVKLDEKGGLEITRKEIGNVPMGEDGTWTIFVYMSGSDLETGSLSGTHDIEEMCAATGENVRFVVQTGGATNWRYDGIVADKLERHVITNGEYKKVAQLPNASMGDAATLRNFLKWGVENYPSAKMGVVLWGHGKGTVEGVCKDDVFDNDFLMLSEINSALSEVSAEMTDKFEFIGLDACLMATLETADILATYARYMIASEELEPLNGWNYTELGNILAKEPNADWDKISQTVCDSFLSESKEKSEHANRVTLSVIELAKLDELLIALNDYSRELCEKLTDREQLRELNRDLEAGEHFGFETICDGYANRLDLGDLANAGRDITDKSAALLSTLESAVIQNRTGGSHPTAAGLSLYYPFKAFGTEELRVVGEVAPCPYYTEFMERMLLSASPAAEFEDLVVGDVAKLCVGETGGGNSPLCDHWRDLGEHKSGGNTSALVKTVGGFSVGKDGKYTVSISPETLRYATSVGIRVFRDRHKRSEDDPDLYVAYGKMLCQSEDWEAGTFSGTFNGQWIMFPNREPISVEPRERAAAGVTYLSEIRIDMEAQVISLFADNVGRVYVEGLWIYGDDGKHTLEKIEDNSTCTAYHDLHNYGSPALSSQSGAKMDFEGAPTAAYEKLLDGEYYCFLEITDVYGDTLKSEIANFTISGGTLSFT